MIRRSGFTLIELLVVVLIIGILSAIAVPQYRKVVEKSIMSEALINLDAIVKAEERYYLENNTYTAVLSDLDVDVKDTDKFEYKVDVATSQMYATRKNSSVYKYLIHAYPSKMPSGLESLANSWRCIFRNGTEEEKLCITSFQCISINRGGSSYCRYK